MTPTRDHEPSRDTGPEGDADAGLAESGVAMPSIESAILGPYPASTLPLLRPPLGLSCGVRARIRASRLARRSAALSPCSLSDSILYDDAGPAPCPVVAVLPDGAPAPATVPFTTIFSPNPVNLAGLVLYRKIRGRSILAIRCLVPLGLSCGGCAQWYSDCRRPPPSSEILIGVCPPELIPLRPTTFSEAFRPCRPTAAGNEGLRVSVTRIERVPSVCVSEPSIGAAPGAADMRRADDTDE